MAKRIIIAEAHADAPKPLRGAPDGSGYRDMARSESSAQELGRPADGKPTAGVGRDRSSGEAGNDRGAKGLDTENVSKGIGVKSLRKRHLTEREIREIGAKRHLTKYPDIALMTERLARKAAAEPKFRFYRLFWWITHEQTLRCAWERVRANGGAPGVDGVTFQMIERSEGGVDGFLAGLQKELRENAYRASPLRRKYIEKANGKMRPLGIPTVKDRVVQCAVKTVIEPIFEEDFHDCSFGFRPNRSAQDAVARIAENVKKGKALAYDADLSSYFDTIPHDKLMAAVQMRISDGRVLGLIRHWLKVCVQEPNGVRISPKGRGTPQGGVISPLLANIYLHWFETIVSLTAKACGQVMSIVRYADDFVILARSWADGFLQRVEGILEGRMGLTVNREKTKVLDFREPHTTLTFLGYDFRMVRDRLFGTGKRYLTFGPSKKSMKGIREKIHAITHARNGLLTVEKVVGRLNKLTKGWGAFYSVGYPSKAFHAVNGYALRRMARFLNRKSQRRYRLKFADTYYGELNHYGMYWLKWADVRRRPY
ncbi:group II intron reverse transcriptase/maturase [Cellulomonas carbonis]|uniref:group II intron reverse transcriptase/maturase n=1 Tax=Cellulomonas carbonis TaxID=1386092 RepID=UPI0009DE4FD5|nr:group II intron reverse transcriptase/maturase [Cellulomonas carbonis]